MSTRSGEAVPAITANGCAGVATNQMEAALSIVTEDPARGRFELDFGGGTAFASYRADGDRVVVTHTEVPAAFSGRGIGSRLVQGMFDRVRDSGRKVVIRCPFVSDWVRRHPDYADLVEG